MARQRTKALLNRRQMNAIYLVTETNLTVAEVAERVGMSQATVRSLLDRDDVIEMQRRAVSRSLQCAANKAASVLISQLDDPNAWVAQNAARTIIQMFENTRKADDASVTVNFLAMPMPAMPKKEYVEPPVASSDAEVT